MIVHTCQYTHTIKAVERLSLGVLYVHMIVAALGMMKSDKNDIVYTIDV